jgi:hypothetical protein
VWTSTTYSKAALRVVAEAIAKDLGVVAGIDAKRLVKIKPPDRRGDRIAHANRPQFGCERLAGLRRERP